MARSRIKNSRSFLAPEIVQTSTMDCGPASLKCLLEGFGVGVSYGRLREACQTDVDGTSIDTMEEVAGQLGLEAEQVLLPRDHLLLPEANALPALVVVRHPNGATHFVVVWRCHVSFVQVMDPATGRRWIARQELLKDVYIHEMTVDARQWREWAGSENFLAPLGRRLRDLGLSKKHSTSLIEHAIADGSWRVIAALDAAARMTRSIVESGGIERGRQAAILLETCFEETLRQNPCESDAIPPNYWMAEPAPADASGCEQLRVRGAVLIAVRGRRRSEQTISDQDENEQKQRLSPELAAALEEKPSRPYSELFRFLRADGLFAPTVLTAALALAAGAVIIEALLFQGLMDLSSKLGLVEQRLGAMALIIIFAVALLLLELPLAAGLLRMGRRLEARLRLGLLEKIPRLGDRYFQSRLISDMAERSHSAQLLRVLPMLGGQFIRLIFELLFTAIGIIWLDPAGAVVVVAVACVAVALPLAMQTRLVERDLRMRSHNAALSRFYLDALLGLFAIRTHGAERAVRREHESLLVEWMHASFGLVRAVVTVEAVQSILGFGLAAWLLLDHLGRAGDAGGVLLLIYWSLNLPMLGEEIALVAHQYPAQRNIMLRALEPLGAPEEIIKGNETDGARSGELMGRSAFACAGFASDSIGERGSPLSVESRVQINTGTYEMINRGVEINFEAVSVRASGHAILDDVDLKIEAGSHIGIVGASGAGKSSLVGLLLGWHRPAAGQILIDGQPLDGRRLEQLRKQTAWVDPAVQLWNRSLIENLCYGTVENTGLHLSAAIEAAHLHKVLENLPDGLQTRLGEGGSMLAGGEGQRVRFGRAMLRSKSRLVILDEPFRGLDRERRRELLTRARTLWRDATLLCITHDVSETRAFERVLVIEGGRIIEDGAPCDLIERGGSRYRDLLEAEEAVRSGLWSSDEWRHVEIAEGMLIE
jgi:ABC-type bacteriocin/lantibiotic exporter with double-glycine peptidase domain